MFVVLAVLGAVVTLAGVYLYGCHVGIKAGAEAGRAASDREWAAMLENGMV